MDTLLEAIWTQCGGNFQKAYVEEWEQEVHSSEYSDQEPEYHWRDPCPRYHQSHDSCVKSESNCGPHCASRHADLRMYTCTYGRRHASRDMSSWQPFPSAPKRKPTEPPEDTRVDVESLDTPTSYVYESIHSIQYGIMPTRLSFPHPEDVSSIPMDTLLG